MVVPLGIGLPIDQESAWEAWEKGNREFEKGNGEATELLIDATDYLDRNPDSGIMEVRNYIKENADKKIPYTKSRPSYAKRQEESVWARGISEDGMVYDPSGEIMTWDKTKPRKGQWDMGHVPGQKYSDVHALFSIGALSKREFLEWYRNPANYRPELPKTNRSHKYE